MHRRPTTESRRPTGGGPLHAAAAPRRAIFALLAGLAAGLTAASAFAQTKIYSWTDDNGVVHFSDSAVPPEHVHDARVMNLRVKPSAPEPSSSVPLEIRNNDPTRKFVRVLLEGERTTREIPMIVDTGASQTLIDRALAEELGLPHVGSAQLIGATGSATGWFGRLRSLKLGAEEISDLTVIVGPSPGVYLLGMDVIHQLGLSIAPDRLYRADR